MSHLLLKQYSFNLLSLKKNHNEILSLIHFFELNMNNILKKLLRFKPSKNNIVYNRFIYTNIDKYWEKYKSLILIRQEFLNILKCIRYEHTKYLNLIEDIEYCMIMKRKNLNMIKVEIDYDVISDYERDRLQKIDFKTFCANDFNKNVPYNFYP